MWFTKHEKWLGDIFYRRSSSVCSCLFTLARSRCCSRSWNTFTSSISTLKYHFRCWNWKIKPQFGIMIYGNSGCLGKPALIQSLILLNSWCPHCAMAMNFLQKKRQHLLGLISLTPDVIMRGSLLLQMQKSGFYIDTSLNTGLKMKMTLNPTGLEHSPAFVDQYYESH